MRLISAVDDPPNQPELAPRYEVRREVRYPSRLKKLRRLRLGPDFFLFFFFDDDLLDDLDLVDDLESEGMVLVAMMEAVSVLGDDNGGGGSNWSSRSVSTSTCGWSATSGSTRGNSISSEVGSIVMIALISFHSFALCDGANGTIG